MRSPSYFIRSFVSWIVMLHGVVAFQNIIKAGCVFTFITFILDYKNASFMILLSSSFSRFEILTHISLPWFLSVLTACKRNYPQTGKHWNFWSVCMALGVFLYKIYPCRMWWSRFPEYDVFRVFQRICRILFENIYRQLIPCSLSLCTLLILKGIFIH